MGKGREFKTQRKNAERRTDVNKINYDDYKFSKVEFCITLMQGIFLLMIVTYYFYGSLKVMLCFSPFLLFFIKSQRKKKNIKRKEIFTEEFKETLILVGECMEAGYSLENSFIESYAMMKERYGNKSDMVRELYLIKQSLKVNVKIEDLLLDLAARTGIEDIRDFAVVFSQAKRGGGNMGYIMKRTIGMIREKMDIKRELQIMLSGKKYENMIMSFVPIGLIAYISATSEVFFDVMYGNIIGIVIMSLCLIAYIGTLFLAEHLMKIEV